MFDVATLAHRSGDVAAQIRDLQRAAYRVEADLINFDQLPPLLEEAEDIRQLDVTFLGVFDSGTLVGLVGYRRQGPIVDIDRLAVHPQRFRKGIGRRLLAAVHERENAERYEVSTGAANGPALALYRGLGYVLTHEQFDGVEKSHLARSASTRRRTTGLP